MIKTYIKRLILMIQFFTTIPLPISLDVDNRDFGKGLVFAPVIGLMIGIILALVYSLIAIILPKSVCVVLIIIFYIILTGGLHFDGLGDTFDGLFSNRPKERILEIMRDSRVGTNAVLAVVSIIFLNVALLYEINNYLIFNVLLFFPVAGRIGSLTSASISKYARSGEGLGKSFIDFCGKGEMIFGSILFFIISVLILSYKGIYIGIILIVSAIVLAKIFGKKIDGVTGDILGAICELNQTIFLLTVIILNKFIV